jgi:hypothetical protein
MPPLILPFIIAVCLAIQAQTRQYGYNEGRENPLKSRKTEGNDMVGGCVSKAVYSGLQARRRKDTTEYIIHEGKRYEYRSDTQIFRHDATRLTRIKKA